MHQNPTKSAKSPTGFTLSLSDLTNGRFNKTLGRLRAPGSAVDRGVATLLVFQSNAAYEKKPRSRTIERTLSRKSFKRFPGDYLGLGRGL